MKTVVLASGGLDSSVLLYLLKREHHVVLPLHVNYGQLAERREWSALKRFCRKAKLPSPVRVDAPGLGKVPSGLTRNGRRWARDPFFPARNLVLVSIGGAIGYSNGTRAVALGLVANALYPDQTKDFVRLAQDSLSESLGSRMLVTAPLLALSKAEVVALGQNLHAPIEVTYSCQQGGDRPCNRCSSCADRTHALEEAKRLSGTARRNRRPPRKRRV